MKSRSRFVASLSLLAVVIVALGGCKSNGDLAAELAKDCAGAISVSVTFSSWGRTVTMTCEVKAESFTK